MKVAVSKWARAWVLGSTVGQTAILGCGESPPPPPSIGPEVRQSIKQQLTTLGAKVTAEEPESLYASLRNSHVAVQLNGGVIESAPRSRQDVQDFEKVNAAVAQQFLTAAEHEAFQEWLKAALSPASPNSARTEYSGYQLNLSKKPLRVVFSQRAPPAE